MNTSEALAHLRQHPELSVVIERTVMPNFTPSGRVYYDLLESIVSQQLSVKAADTIFKRFLTLFPDGHPHPEQLIEIPMEQLRSVGLSGQKSTYIQNVARFAQEHDLESLDWHALTDDEILELLTAIKGVGKWTVQMVLMFTLGRPDIFPIDDLGIQQGMVRLFKIEEQGKALKAKMLELAEPWRPYRTVACRYLWRWKDTV